MNVLPFTDPENGWTVRTVEIDGEPWLRVTPRGLERLRKVMSGPGYGQLSVIQ